MNDSFVSSLRGITEEGDLNTILKPAIGGFTKKSVQEYLSIVKSQQQGLKDEYLKEVARIQTEKDALSDKLSFTENKLKTADAKAEEKFKARISELEAEKESLEKDMDEALARIRSDEAKISQYETKGVMLSTANGKIDELNAYIKTQEEELKSLRESEAEMRSKLADMNLSETNMQLEKLLVCNEQLKNEIGIRDAQIESGKTAYKTLEKQLENSRETAESIAAELELIRGQNEWLECENKSLTAMLNEKLEKEIDYCRELSRLKAEIAILQRKNSALELKHESDRSVI